MSDTYNGIPIRTKWMDPDFRRDPDTTHFCIMCSRDLKPNQPHRIVRFEPDKYEAIHPEDWPTEEVHGFPIEECAVGMDCAKRLGLEWSSPSPCSRGVL